MSVKSNISISLYTRVSLLQSGRVYTILPYANCSCSLLFSRIIHGFSVVPRGKLRSWKVGKLLPLLVCPRCVIDTGHGMDGSVEGEAAKNGRTEGRRNGWTDGCGMQPPRGSICPQGPSCAHLFLAIDFHCAPRLAHAITANARTRYPSPPPTHPYPSLYAAALCFLPLLTSPVLSLCLSFAQPFFALVLPSLPVFLDIAAHSNVTWSGQQRRGRVRKIERGV